MKTFHNFSRLRLGRRKYVLNVAVLVLSLLSPLIIDGSTASAAQTTTNYSDSTATAQAQQITSANGSLWYVRSGGGSDSTVDTIGNMTTSGTTSNYSIMPSGESYMKLTDVTTGPDGNVWFVGCSSADATNWTIQAGFINVTTGAVAFKTNTTLGGALPCNATSGSLPGAITTAPDGNVWYVVNLVRTPTAKKVYLFSVNPSTGATTTAWVGDYTTYVFYGMTVGPDGKLWLTDQDNAVRNGNIRVFTISAGTATLTTTYSLGTNVFPTAIIAAQDGNIWFIKSSNTKIAKMTTGGVTTEYSLPSGVAARSLIAGPTGDDTAIWFTTTNSGIGRMNTNGVTTLNATGDTTANAPWFTSYYKADSDIVLGPDNAMWFTTTFSGGGYGLGRTTTALHTTNYADSSATAQPQQITTADGSLWYVRGGNGSDTTIDTIGKTTLSGAKTNYSIMPTGATYMKLTDVTTGPDGNVWFVGCSSASSTNWTVQAGFVNVATGAVTFYTNTTLGGALPCNATSGSLPADITTGSDGRLWYVVNLVRTSSAKKAYLFSVSPSTGTTTTGWTGDYSTYVFYGMTSGPDGKLWLTNQDNAVRNGSMRVFTVSAGTATLTSSYALGSNMYPTAITTGPDGNLWFIKSSNTKIAKMTTSGVMTEYSLASGVAARSLVAGPAGDSTLWFTTTNSGIGRITTGGSVTLYPTGDTVAAAPWFETYYTANAGITVGPDNALWFTATFPGGGLGIGRLGY